MNQASKLLSSMKEIAEIKQAQLELQDKKVVQYVPENKRKEWNDSFTRHLTNLMAHRNDLESRVAVAEPKAFDKAGGKEALEATRADRHKAGPRLESLEVDLQRLHECVDVKPYERQPASMGCKLIGFDPLPCIWLLFGGGGASERIDFCLLLCQFMV